MGAYVSKSECPELGYELNCSMTFDNSTGLPMVGGLKRGEIAPDGDIAGIGVVSVFVGVTSFALVLSIIALIWNVRKGLKPKASEEERQLKEERGGGRFSITGICEAVVLSCSDQQVFTGGAYAITLRYMKGCTITAYHYNIVANMMLLSCATHLMSVTIVRDYWRYPWLAAMRVIVISCLFLVTGMLLGNQGGNEDEYYFPTTIPEPGDETFLLFRNAACFQSNHSDILNVASQTTKSAEQFGKVLVDSTPGNRIQGWNYYVIILLWYATSLVVELFRYFRRGADVPGWRFKFYERLRDAGVTKHFSGPKVKRFFWGLLMLYIVGGVVISGITVGFTANFIYGLRSWVRASGWLEDRVPENNSELQRSRAARLSSEDVATEFGQMVPIFLCVLTIFAFVEKASDMASVNRKARRYTITGSVTPGAGRSRSNTFGPDTPGPNDLGGQQTVSDKTGLGVYETNIGVANTPGTGISPAGLTPGMTPMTPGFPIGVAIDGAGQYPGAYQYSTAIASPYSSQVRFANNTGSTPLLAGTPMVAGNGTPGFATAYTPGSVVNGNGGGYFMIGNSAVRQNSNLSATTTLNPATTTPGQQIVPGPIQPAMPVQQGVSTQQIMPGQPLTGTPPPIAVGSPSPPIGVALGVPASMLAQPSPPQQSSPQQQSNPPPQQQQQQQVAQPQVIQEQPAQQQPAGQQPAYPQQVQHRQTGSGGGYFYHQVGSDVPITPLHRRAT